APGTPPTGCAGRGAGIGSGGWAREWTAQATAPAATVTRGTSDRRLTGTPPPGWGDTPSLRPATAAVNWLGRRKGGKCGKRCRWDGVSGNGVSEPERQRGCL